MTRPTPTTSDELQARYFELFDTTTKLHLMKGVDSHLLEQTKTLLDAVLANLVEAMARVKEEEPKISWWEPDHWVFD